MPEKFRLTCSDYARMLFLIAYEAAGVANTRHSLRPLFWEGRVSCMTRVRWHRGNKPARPSFRDARSADPGSRDSGFDAFASPRNDCADRPRRQHPKSEPRARLFRLPRTRTGAILGIRNKPERRVLGGTYDGIEQARPVGRRYRRNRCALFVQERFCRRADQTALLARYGAFPSAQPGDHGLSCQARGSEPGQDQR